MKSKFYLIFLFAFLSLMQIKSQVRFEINEMSISNIKPYIVDGVIIEDEKIGPFIVLECTLYNDSKNDIELNLTQSETKISINYQRHTYTINVFNLKIEEVNRIILKSNEKFDFYFQSSFLYRTGLWKGITFDYTEVLLEILPTLRVHYHDDSLNVESTRIIHVRLN